MRRVLDASGPGKVVAASAIVMVLLAPMAAAQMPLEFGAGVGISIPTGATSNGLMTGWHGTALVQL
jgi:hypothetical protein